jgi:hypothetical protein
MSQISRILEIESRYGLSNQSPEIGIAFLVNQHIKEILDKYTDPVEVVNLTFTREFNNMLQVCLFVPFLHAETPRPAIIPKSELKLNYLLPKPDLITSVIQMRQAILQTQSQSQELDSRNLGLKDHRNLMMSNIPEQASFHEDEEEDEDSA